MAEVTTNFRDSGGGDLGKNLVSKEYLISVYPKLASSILDPQIWCWGHQAVGGNSYTLLAGDNNPRRTPIPFEPNSRTAGWKTVTARIGLKNDGTIWVWGENVYGSLGNNLNGFSFQVASSPVRESTSSTNWKKIGLTGQNVKAAIKTDGTLWTWGVAAHGELGANISGQGFFLSNLTTGIVSRSSPVRESTSSTNWKEVYPQLGHTLAIKTDGTLWASGANYLGQLGINSRLGRSSFVQVGTDNRWKKISPYTLSFFNPPGPNTESFTLGLKTDGSVWCWGSNYFNFFKLSNASTFSITPRQIFTGVSVPTNVTGDNNTFSGNSFISNTGILYTWGANYGGAVGRNTSNSDYVMSPVRESTSSTNWKQICGHNAIYGRFFGIKGDGTLWVWGTESTTGTLGLNQTVPSSTANRFLLSRSSPVREFTSSTNWKQVSLYSNTVLAIKTDGTLWGWGNNTSGQLGVNDNISRSTPIRIGLESNWSTLSSGVAGDSIHAIKTDGTLWGWGNNFYGKLGVNDSISRSTPVREFTSSNNWTFVSHGYKHVAAIKSDGSLWTWGTNSRGSLGINSGNGTVTPVRESTLSTWTHCACGGDNTYAIKTDGTLWSCGSNYLGSLGTNRSFFNSFGLSISPITSQLTFVQEFTSSTNWKMVQFPNMSFNSNINSGHSQLAPILALKTDGSLWAWGDNHRCQMGYNGLSNVLTPVREGTNSTWKDICAWSGASAIGTRFFGIKSNGTLWNFNGGGFISHEGSWAKLSVTGTNDENIHIIKTDGTLWSLGTNQFGTAGNNIGGGSVTLPQQEWTSSTNWKSVSSGYRAVFAVQSLISP